MQWSKDTRGIIRTRKSKERQCNGQKTMQWTKDNAMVKRQCNGQKKTRGIIRTRKSKERQCNGQKKTSKGTNNDPQITIKKTKERVTQKNVFLAGKQFLFH
jgi:hypothetical protein